MSTVSSSWRPLVVNYSAKTAPQWLSVKQQAVFAEYFAREQSDKIRRGQESCRQRGVFGFSSSAPCLAPDEGPVRPAQGHCQPRQMG